MSFDRNKFALISAGFPGITPRIWGYETEDDFVTVVEPESGGALYFADEKGQLIDGDIINVRFLNPFGFPMLGVLRVGFNDPATQFIFVALQGPWVYNVLIPNVSTPQSVFVSIPTEVQLIGYGAILSGQITVANANLTLKSLPTSTLIVGSALALGTGLAAGASFNVFLPPDVTAVISSTQGVEVITDGASTGAVAANITLLGL